MQFDTSDIEDEMLWTSRSGSQKNRRVFSVSFTDQVMAAAVLEDERSCHICQKPHTGPVSLPCGHVFCLLCIQDHLDAQDESRFYTCPQCGKRFTVRPSLQMKPRGAERPRCERETAQVPCTYCVNPSAPAVRTCVQCEVSLCPAHLAPHESLGHKLVNATNSLENQKCSVHNLPLEYYCRQDSACICSDCHLLGEHLGHPTNTLHQAVKKKKEELRNNLQTLVSERKETRTTIKRLRESLGVEEEKGSKVENQVIAVFRNLQDQLHALEKNVLSDVCMQNNQVLKYHSNVISKLKEEDKERSRSISDIKRTLHMTEPLSILQQETAPGEAAACKQEEDEDKKPPIIREMDADLILANMHKSLTEIVTYSFNTDVKYIKEERVTNESQCDETKQEVDTEQGSTYPECGDVTVSPVKNGNTYRLEMKSSGLFSCKYTGIKFRVKNPLIIEYEIDSWRNHMTPIQRDGCAAISPLFNIKTSLQPGEVSAVYLPHTLSAADCDMYKPYIKCVHYRPGKIVLETPTQIDPSYVILEDPSFCCLGALIEKMWMCISSFFSFPGAVLMFGKKLVTKYLIHLYLVPDHESEIKEVIQTNKLGNGFHLFDVPAYVRNACTKKKYIVSGPQGAFISPKELHFLFTKPSAQYPYSNIRIDNRTTSISLTIREKGSDDKIWECHLDEDDLERLSKLSKGYGSISVSKMFIQKNYKSLCARLPLLPPILLDLRLRGVIDADEEETLLRSTSPSSIINDELLKMIVRKGAEEEFCKVLTEKDPRLVEDLEGRTASA
ncbi:uncharacterized protein LOC143785328 [Ranitomeya variabilis]|uniref:uncharacterized protein LOC143785328 n=1 Tax=Ranitomeya variabilis TaxID=490064 RepID=UPI004055F14C